MAKKGYNTYHSIWQMFVGSRFKIGDLNRVYCSCLLLKWRYYKEQYYCFLTETGANNCVEVTRSETTL